MGYYDITQDFSESKYHGKNGKHPVRFPFFQADMSLEETEKLRNYFSDVLLCKVRTKRENRQSVFMVAESKQKEAVEYCFNKCNDIVLKFNIKAFNIDLTILQK